MISCLIRSHHNYSGDVEKANPSSPLITKIMTIHKAKYLLEII